MTPDTHGPTDPSDPPALAANNTVVVGECPVCHNRVSCNSDRTVGAHVYYDRDNPVQCYGSGYKAVQSDA